jgi:hypothetical protein
VKTEPHGTILAVRPILIFLGVLFLLFTHVLTCVKLYGVSAPLILIENSLNETGWC